MSKYNNKKVEYENIVFDSQLEFEYFQELIKKRSEGLIKDFKMKESFVLIDGYEMNGKKVRPVKLVPDFVIENLDGSIEYHDTKGFVKPLDVIKKKMFESRYGKPLVFIGKSIVDGGYVDHDTINKGRKERRKNKSKK